MQVLVGRQQEAERVLLVVEQGLEEQGQAQVKREVASKLSLPHRCAGSLSSIIASSVSVLASVASEVCSTCTARLVQALCLVDCIITS
jgi:hypothetical protein